MPGKRRRGGRQEASPELPPTRRQPNLDADIEALTPKLNQYLEDYPELHGESITPSLREQAQEEFVRLRNKFYGISDRVTTLSEDDYEEIRGPFDTLEEVFFDRVEHRAEEYERAPVAEGGRRRKTRKASKKRRNTRRK